MTDRRVNHGDIKTVLEMEALSIYARDYVP
jgi:hypothetical protein